MRSPRRFSLLDGTLLIGVFLWLLFVSAAGPALAATSEPFAFESADIQTVVKQVAALTGITFVFDSEQVKGKITLLSPKAVSPTVAGWDFYEPPGLTRGGPLMAELKRVAAGGSYDVVIIDPLMEAYPVKDENDNAEATTQMLAIRTLARSTKAAVIAVHNSGLRKGKRNPKFLGRGATARVDRADVSLNFTAVGENERELHVAKARGKNLDQRIRFKFAGQLGYQLMGTGLTSIGAPEAGVNKQATARSCEIPPGRDDRGPLTGSA